MSQMPEAVPIDSVKDSLFDRSFYVVHGETEDDEEPGWRVAWWDADDQGFYDTRGERVCGDDVEVIPHPLPER